MAAVNVTLSAFAAAAPLLLGGRLDISCPLGAQQQTRRTPLLRSIDGTDNQTDKRRDTRPLHRQCYAYYADSVSKVFQAFSFDSIRRMINGPLR